MTNHLFSKVSMITMPMMIAGCLFVSGTPAMAQANFGASAQGQPNFKHCSDPYAFWRLRIRRRRLASPRAWPFPSVPLRRPYTTFDGKGNLSWLESTVVDGHLLEPDWTQATGTYTVNPDCTGTAVVNTPKQCRCLR
jgi:hypothetical protein